MSNIIFKFKLKFKIVLITAKFNTLARMPCWGFKIITNPYSGVEVLIQGRTICQRPSSNQVGTLGFRVTRAVTLDYRAILLHASL